MWRINPLLEILIGLEVRSAGLVERADDWLKPILAGSLAYQKLVDQKNIQLEIFNDRKKATRFSLFLSAIGLVLYWLMKQPGQPVGLAAILVGLCLAAMLFLSAGLWVASGVDYQAAVKEVERFGGQWLRQVQADPESVEKLVDLHQKIQECEALQRKNQTGGASIRREQTLEFILDAGDDPAQALERYFSMVKGSGLNGAIRGCLLGHPLPYALVYQAAPGEFSAFMNACYTKYAEDPFGFDSSCVERIFDQVILKAAGG